MTREEITEKREIERDRIGGCPSVSLQEEEEVLKYYGRKLREVVEALKLPDRVLSCAATLYRRIALLKPPTEQAPKHTVLVAAYLGSKAEESYVSAEDLAKVLREDSKAVLKREPQALESLNFELKCHCPFRALKGICADIDERLPVGSSINKRFPGLIRRARDDLAHLLASTDAPLLHPPGQLAAGSLLWAAKAFGEECYAEVEREVHSCAERAGVSEGLQSALPSVAELLEDGQREQEHGALDDIAERLKKFRTAKQQQQQSNGDGS